MKKLKQTEIVLAVLLCIYIIFPIGLPYEFSQLFQSTLGIIIVSCLAIFLYTRVNTIVGVLGFFAAYKLINNSSNLFSNHIEQNYITPESRKQFDSLANKPFPITLEEEVVKLRVPTVNHSVNTHDSKFKPTWSTTINNSKVNKGN